MLSFKKIIVPIAVLMTATSISASSAQSTPEQRSENQEGRTVLLSSVVNFEPPSESGDPYSTAAGGSRSNCPQYQSQSNRPVLPLTPLLPKTTDQFLTVKQRPTFFVYVPPTSASTILFQLKDNQDQIIYQSLIPVSASTGKIVDVQMSKSDTSLNIGQKYQWSAFLLCHYDSLEAKNDLSSFETSYDLMNDPWITGNVTRIATSSTLNQKSENNLSMGLVNQYAEKGLWFDTLATLHQMIKQQPEKTQLVQTWQQLLESQGLEKQISNTQL